MTWQILTLEQGRMVVHIIVFVIIIIIIICLPQVV